MPGLLPGPACDRGGKQHSTTMALSTAGRTTHYGYTAEIVAIIPDHLPGVRSGDGVCRPQFQLFVEAADDEPQPEFIVHPPPDLAFDLGVVAFHAQEDTLRQVVRTQAVLLVVEKFETCAGIRTVEDPAGNGCWITSKRNGAAQRRRLPRVRTLLTVREQMIAGTDRIIPRRLNTS